MFPSAWRHAGTINFYLLSIVLGYNYIDRMKILSEIPCRVSETSPIKSWLITVEPYLIRNIKG